MFKNHIESLKYVTLRLTRIETMCKVLKNRKISQNILQIRTHFDLQELDRNQTVTENDINLTVV